MLAAITVPMGFTTSPATPVGLMISGRHYDEPTLFEVRRLLSQLADSVVAYFACMRAPPQLQSFWLWACPNRSIALVLVMLTRASCGCAGRLCVRAGHTAQEDHSSLPRVHRWSRLRILRERPASVQ